MLPVCGRNVAYVRTRTFLSAPSRGQNGVLVKKKTPNLSTASQASSDFKMTGCFPPLVLALGTSVRLVHSGFSHSDTHQHSSAVAEKLRSDIGAPWLLSPPRWDGQANRQTWVYVMDVWSLHRMDSVCCRCPPCPCPSPRGLAISVSGQHASLRPYVRTCLPTNRHTSRIHGEEVLSSVPVPDPAYPQRRDEHPRQLDLPTGGQAYARIVQMEKLAWWDVAGQGGDIGDMERGRSWK